MPEEAARLPNNVRHCTEWAEHRFSPKARLWAHGNSHPIVIFLGYTLTHTSTDKSGAENPCPIWTDLSQGDNFPCLIMSIVATF